MLLENQFPIILTAPKFVPAITSLEAKDLGYEVDDVYPAGVRLRGTFEDAMRLNLLCRTAHRVLIELTSFRTTTPDDLYRHAVRFDWSAVIPNNGYFSVVSSVDTPTISNTQFANVKLKDAIVDSIRRATGKRPDSGADTTKAVIFLYWKGPECTISIDTSGTPISKRGYRMQTHNAPMSELLASACIRSTKWKSSTPFINPMCGSGTLAIEAALVARNIPSQWNRNNFGFMHLVGYNHDRWMAIREAEGKHIMETALAPIIATDRDSSAVMATRSNARKAGVFDSITATVSDFRKTNVPEGEGVVILNPEYGERLGTNTALEEVYESIGDWFKKSCEGKFGYVFTGNMQAAKSLGLKPSRKIPFYNGDIECRLFEYELYGGTRKQKHQSTNEETELAKSVKEAFDAEGI